MKEKIIDWILKESVLKFIPRHEGLTSTFEVEIGWIWVMALMPAFIIWAGNIALLILKLIVWIYEVLY